MLPTLLKNNVVVEKKWHSKVTKRSISSKNGIGFIKNTISQMLNFTTIFA